MRLIWCAALLVVFVFAPQPRAKASTFNLPLAGQVEVVGDLSQPIPISISLTVIPHGASYWVFNSSIEQSGDIGGPLSEPQGCIGTTCGTLAGFYVCGGGKMGCGIDFPQGTIASRDGEPISFDVSDASRYLTIDTSVLIDGPIAFELTATLPDGFKILTISDPIPKGLAQTPLPGALSLFATGLGVLTLLGWRRRRKAAQLLLAPTD